MDNRALVYPLETSIEFTTLNTVIARVQRLAFPMRFCVALSLLPFFFYMSVKYTLKASYFEWRQTFREMKATTNRR